MSSYNVDDDSSDDFTMFADIDREAVELSRIEEEDLDDEEFLETDSWGMSAEEGLAVEDWEERQVLRWLGSISLGHLSAQFKGKL